jgi:pyridoxine 4-dehydrogenase
VTVDSVRPRLNRTTTDQQASRGERPTFDASLPAAASGHRQVAEGLTVTRLGYGTMQLPGPGIWGPPTDRDAAIAVLRRAVDLGVTQIDTSHAYGPQLPPGMGQTEQRQSMLGEVARRHAATWAQVALAWLLARSPVTLATPGTKSLAHLEENVAAGRVSLSEIDLAELDKLVESA